MIPLLLLLVMWGVPGEGPETPQPFIDGADRSAAEEPDSSVTEGLRLIGELGCTSCHPAADGDDRWLLPRRAPRLDKAAARISPSHLFEFIVDPATTHHGTVMPEMLSHLDEEERQVAARHLVNYLVDRAGESWREHIPDQVLIEEGDRLYHQVGCVGCHEPLGRESTILSHSNRLTGRVEHWSQSQLASFLREPRKSRPAGRMPAMGLNHREANAIAHFLLRHTQVTAPLDLAIDRGHRKGLDDSSRSHPWTTTVAQDFQLTEEQSKVDRTSHYSGWLRVEESGEYHFFLKVDDIGRLRIDDEDVIDLGQTRNYQRKKVVEGDARMFLESGLHRIEVSHFQWVEDAILQLEWAGPGIERGPIDSSLLSNHRQPLAPTPRWTPEPGSAEVGKELYEKFGCIHCHEDGAASSGTELARLAGRSAQQPHAAYSLTTQQGDDLQTALKFLASNPDDPSPHQRVDLTMRTFRCTACHSRGEMGGVPEDRRDFFTGSDPLLGDEGRLPPPLTGVGDKLQPHWLDDVIQRGRSVRGYMNTRMPHFGNPQVENLGADLIAIDRKKSVVPPLIADDETAKAAGHKMAGVGMLQCVLCHDFNRKQSVGMRAMDLVNSTERLNRDWFHRYLLDPESLRPGTQMLAFWPEGRSMIPELLDGDADQQVQALWRYLEDGDQAVFPEGLSRQQKELIVGGEALLYRGKLWHAGFRGIAVGLPEGLHYAFDAQELRLALMWKGRFLDASAHWSSQGMGRIRPLGDDVLTFPHGPDIVFLTDVFCPWPGEREEGIRAPGYRFRGYRLAENKTPTLLYSTDYLDVEETIVAVEEEGAPFLRRTVQYSVRENPQEKGLFHLRVRDIPPLEVRDDGTCIYEDGLQVKLADPVDLTSIRPMYTVPEKWETWIHLPFSREPTEITIEYRWGKERR